MIIYNTGLSICKELDTAKRKPGGKNNVLLQNVTVCTVLVKDSQDIDRKENQLRPQSWNILDSV